jgi:excisionase family DNA binding protein
MMRTNEEKCEEAAGDGNDHGALAPAGELMTYAEAAVLLNVPKGTLYTWVFEKRVPHIRLGKRMVRFSRLQIAKWLQANNVPAREAGA